MHVDLGFMAYECVVMNEFCFFLKILSNEKTHMRKKNEKYRSTHKFVCFDDDNFGCVLFDVCHKKNYMKRPIIHSGENSMTNRATNHCDP